MRPLLPRLMILILLSAFGLASANAQLTPSMKGVTNISWQWQLSSTPTSSQLLKVKMYDVDGFDASTSLVTAMHQKSIKAVCYIDAGTWEDWRSDASKFPSSVKGRSNGWPGEKWLDIRKISTLSPIMTARFQMCKSKGFDAVEPDNIDGYSNRTGFPLSYQDQIKYNTWIAKTVQSLGMTVALKNDVEQASDLEPVFNFAINEECFSYDECDALLPFVDAKKPVFEVEYSLSTSKFCPTANAMDFNAMKKDEDLTAYRVACR